MPLVETETETMHNLYLCDCYLEVKVDERVREVVHEGRNDDTDRRVWALSGKVEHDLQPMLLKGNDRLVCA